MQSLSRACHYQAAPKQTKKVGVDERLVSFATYWDEVERTVTRLTLESSRVTADKVLAAVYENHSSLVLSRGETQLPLLALVTSAGEQDQVLREVCSGVKKDCFHVARVSASCTTLPNTLKQIATQLREGGTSGCRLLDSSEKYSGPLVLSRIVADVAQKHSSISTVPHCLLLVVAGADTLPAPLLSSLVAQATLSRHSRMPLILLLGMASSVNTVQSLLPGSLLPELALTSLSSPPPLELAYRVLDETLLSPRLCLHPSGRLLQDLLDSFLFMSLSLTSLVRQIRFALLQHFSVVESHRLLVQQPVKASSLLHSASHLDKNLEKLLTAQLAVHVKDEREEMRRSYSDFYTALHVWRCLNSDLPRGEKRLTQLYCDAASRNITETKRWRQMFDLLRLSSRAAVSSALQRAAGWLRHADEGEAATAFSLAIQKLQTAPAATRPSSGTANSTPGRGGLQGVGQTSAVPGPGTKRVTMEEVQSELRTQMEHPAVEEESAGSWKQLRSAFVKYLTPAGTLLPLASSFYVDTRLEAATNPDLVQLRHHAITTLPKHLHDEPTAPHNRTILRAVYSVLLEQNTETIELNNWLSAVSACLAIDYPSEELQARISRAISQLQFMGLVRSRGGVWQKLV